MYLLETNNNIKYINRLIILQSIIIIIERNIWYKSKMS